MNNDRTYETVGVRGFGFPGDYASHILVMVNGHNMADNIFNYMLYFENDFPIEMNLIKQIEIIRGPASALYGSNAMFATINIVTKSPAEAGPLTLTADTGSFGEKKAQIVETASLGGVSVLFSGSVFNNAGQSPLFFPEFDTPQNNNGNAIDMTGEKGYHFFSTLDWRRWTITAAFSGDSKIQPISWGPTIFNDPGRRTTTSAITSTQRMSVKSPAARSCGGPIMIRFITKAAATTRLATARWKITGKARSAIG